MLTALLAIITVIFIIIYLGGLQPASEPLPDYTTMDKAELSALVLVNPNWHEPRARLARLLLDEENAASALQHMLILAWADWDTMSLEKALINLIQEDPAQAEACLALLADQRLSWLWPKELSVQIALIINKAGIIMDNLPALLRNNSQHPLAMTALTKYMREDPLTAWEIAALLGPDYLGQVTYTIFSLPLENQAVVIPAIINKHPQTPEAMILEALADGENGLESLLKLEEIGFQPWDNVQYSEIKLKLLLQASPNTVREEHVRHMDFAGIIKQSDSVRTLSEGQQSYLLDLFLVMEELGHEPAEQKQYSYLKYTLLQSVVPREAHLRELTESYFLYILPEDIFYLIENWSEKLYWAGYDEHSLMRNIDFAASVLAETPQWAHIKTIITPPAPPAAMAVLTADDRRDQGQINKVSLSPDGTQLIYFTANTIWWYDINRQEYRLAQSTSQHESVSVHWAPDSRSFVLEHSNPQADNRIQVFTIGQTDAMEANIDQAMVMGWQDNSTLLLATKTPTGYRVSGMMPANGRTSTVDFHQHQPVLTPAGKIAWAFVSGNVLDISIQNSVSSFRLPEEELTVLGWLPGDRGILLSSKAGEFWLIDFATGKVKEFDVKGTFTPYSQGWSMDNKILGSFALGLVNHVMILDIENSLLEHTGIVSHFGGFSGPDYYWHIYAGSIYIYKVQ